MTTITATFAGRTRDLEHALGTAIRDASLRRICGQTLTCQYHCETTDYDQALQAAMDSIDIDRAEELGCELLTIG